jgi:membrane protease subunit HflK
MTKNHEQNEQALDAAGKSLAEALRLSFAILKVIMVILAVLFGASGFRMVGPDERALVLRFGKIRGAGDERVLGPGLHWIFPYPVESIVKIGTEKKVNLAVNSFWYRQDPSELLGPSPQGRARIPRKLDPVREGYCITRSYGGAEVSTGSDYNMVHCKWQLTYKIDDPERFFQNVYVDEPRPGQGYFDVALDSVKPLLTALFDDAVVTAMVEYTVDEALQSRSAIPQHTRRLLQKKLDGMESGITAVSIQLTDITWPRQVNDAFLASIRASQEQQRLVSEAASYAENTLNEVAGPVGGQLLAAVKDPSAGERDMELLWSRLAGQAQEKIAAARAYRTQVVETAGANARYLEQILPEYRRRPELVVQKIYQDAIETVLKNADEKIIIQPTEGEGPREIRLMLNRDPSIKPRSGERD